MSLHFLVPVTLKSSLVVFRVYLGGVVFSSSSSIFFVYTFVAVLYFYLSLLYVTNLDETEIRF